MRSMQASSAQQSHILELQFIDSEIMQANTKLKSLPEIEQLLHIDKRITSANEELAQVKAEADQIALELRRGEVDVETVTDRIKKDEARLSSGNATPKELEQLQHEIESLKKRQVALEVVAKIEKPLLDLYEKIRASNGGIGAASLVADKCNGCNLTINAVEMNRIKALAADELLRCEECRRILVRI